MGFLLKSLCLVFVAFHLYAAPSPEARVDEMFNKVKEEGSAGMIDFVHWDTEYQRMPAEQKQFMQVNSAEEYKNKMKLFLSDPAKQMEKEMKNKMNLENIPVEQQNMMKAMIDQQLAQMKEKMEKENAELAKAEYKILNKDVGEKRASFDIEVTKPSGSETNKLVLELIDGNWYLPISELQKTNTRHTINR